MTGAELARAATRPLRRARRVLATTDPDRARLRLASGTIATLLVVAVVLFVGATATGQPVTAVIPGIVLAMIASMAVREVRPGPRAVTILLLVPASLASITLASLLGSTPLLVDAVFVAVAVVSVYLRALGPRGTALGMLAFFSYFLAVFVHVTPVQLPVVAAAQLVAAGITIGVRLLLTPRRSDHDLQRMIAALGYRAHRVVEALTEAIEAGGAFDERLRRTVGSRLVASSSTASSVEDVLDAAEEPVLDGIGNDELGVRVLDFQLTVERLTEAVQQLLDGPEVAPAERMALGARLREFGRVVAGPVRIRRATPTDAPQGVGSPPPVDAGPRLRRIDRILAFGTSSWEGVASRGQDAADRTDDAQDSAVATDDAAGDQPDRAQQLRDLSRQAVQVAVAAALAIAAGTAISSTRWFWAVIAAFVVYVGTSTRGEILTKGWLRVIGTLGGVVVGVVVAALVGGNTVLAVVLIVVCLFAGVYLVSVSSAFMIFFITTMLALLYGLLGEFSVGLLLTRLAETAAGAAIGVGVAYVVLPTSTRDVARDRMRDFLDELATAVTSAADRLTGEPAAAGRPADAPDDADEARAVRAAFEALRTAAQPITRGLAGVADRSGSRRTMQILAVCEYHCRALLRLADSAPGAADTPALRHLIRNAASAVRADVELLASVAGSPTEPRTTASAATALDALEAHPDLAASPERARLEVAAGDLRAIDRAIRDRAAELGLAAKLSFTG